MTDQDRYDALRATKLAAELSDEQCRRLADLVTLSDLDAGRGAGAARARPTTTST